MAQRWLLAAVAVHMILALPLATGKAGLQYDEALMVLGSVHMRNSPQELILPHDPDTWICLAGRCIPLMTVRYVGALKEYLCLVAFGLFGSNALVLRIVSALLGALCVWGLGRFIGQRAGPAAGLAAAMLLAVNPSYTDQTVFDNGAVAVWMAALGFLLVAAAKYLETADVKYAAAAGFAVGLGVWARANFVWLAAAGVIGFSPQIWRWLRASPRHAAAAAAGGCIGAAPFVAYQAVSNFGTVAATGMFSAAESGWQLFAIRAATWAESLLADREHRAIWAGPAMPGWQIWLFPALVLAGIALCLATRHRGLAITALLFYAALFSSRLPVAEHHFVTALPVVAGVIALGCSGLAARFPRTKPLLAGLAILYGGVAIDWQLRAAQGIRRTGGVGQWSDGIDAAALYLERNYAGREIKIADWGLQNNLYVITAGRVKSREIYPEAQPPADPAKYWSGELDLGGVYLTNGPDNLQMKEAAEGFTREARQRGLQPTVVFPDKTGRVYAELWEIGPAQRGAAGGAAVAVNMADPAQEGQLSGFHQIEDNTFRWTRRRFAVTLDAAAGSHARLKAEVYLPETLIQQLGPLTLKAWVGGVALEPETFTASGKHSYERLWAFKSGKAVIEFEVDKALTEPGGQRRELGIVVTSVGVY